MIAGAGQRDEAQIAFQDDRLGFAGNARQAEPTRAQPLRHHAFAAQGPILAHRRDQSLEVARIGHGAAHGLRVGDGMFAIAEGHRARLREQPDLRDLAPRQPLGQRRRWVDANLGVVAGAPQNEIDDRRGVDRRVGVRAGHEAGDAAGRRGGARSRDCLAMLGPRLADEGAHVDEAWRDDVAAAIDNARVARNLVARDRGPDAGDETVHR